MIKDTVYFPRYCICFQISKSLDLEMLIYKTVFTLSVLIKGYFTECRENCTSCRGPHSYICTSCIATHLLYRGHCHPCPVTCLACNGYNCSSCQPGFHGDRCNNRCPLNCYKCQNNRCIQCRTGYYFETIYNQCKWCSSNCIHCGNKLKCNACKEGYYLKEISTGTISCEKCKASEPACQTQCLVEHCKTCTSRPKVCSECYQGYSLKGEICVSNREKCSRGCSTECDSSGICLGNCNDGWTGTKCEVPCPTQCLKCNRSVCQRCADGLFTSACNVECPSTCKRVEGGTTCRIDDGYCESCENNFWGQFCNMTCPIGCNSFWDNSNICYRNNGSCRQGCREYLQGYKCDQSVISSSKGTFQRTSKEKKIETLKTTTIVQTITKQPYVESSETSIHLQGDRTIITFIVLTAGGGLTLIIVTSIIIVYFVRKRRRRMSKRIGNANIEIEADIGDIEANGNLQPGKPSSNDCIYAQVNKVNRGNKGREKIQGAGSSNTYDLDVEEVLVERGYLDDTDLEEIRENISFSESGTLIVDIPMSDTYYNTGSLHRSRIEMSKLSEYIKNKTDYNKEFERLPTGLTRVCSEALKPNSRTKNRYNGIYAYDATRVVLGSGIYVNANFIVGRKNCPAYIASLGPTKCAMNQFETFWEMIWQEKTYKIVMLTKLDEAKKMKCEKYWPEQGNENIYGDYRVRCTAQNIFSEFIMRDFIVTRGNDTREVAQYQYTAWPDKTVPDSVASLLEFRDIVEQKQSNTAGPMVVHCSAGIGRTGTYIALDILIKEGKDDQSVDIFGCVNTLRGQRVQMVQNLEQYIYLHHCVQYALCCYPEPIPVSTMTHFTTDERMSKQHQAFVSLQQLANSDKIMGATNKSRKENRTGADIPDDKHRVRLALIEKDYINAVYVNGYQECNKFILAQTPVQGTLEGFVSMLYQERCSCVVCLDDENVLDKSIVQYLPSVNKVATFGQFQVICTDIDRKQDFISRKLQVSRIGVSLSEEVSVFHYQFKGWSSIDCVPRSIQSFLNLVTDVEKTYQSLNSKHPIVVHCSTGAERSGLFCAVSILLEKVAVEKEVSVLNTVCQVCSKRRSAFQDIEHLRFCYNCVEQMSEVSDSSTYYNYRNM